MSKHLLKTLLSGLLVAVLLILVGKNVYANMAFTGNRSTMICINQSIPDGHVITRYESTTKCPNYDPINPNAIQIQLAVDGLRICHTSPIPLAYVVTKYEFTFDCIPKTDVTVPNAVTIRIPTDGMLICQTSPVPKGFVITRYDFTFDCIPKTDVTVPNAVTIRIPTDGMLICQTSPVPEGFVITGYDFTFDCIPKNDVTIPNAVIISLIATYTPTPTATQMATPTPTPTQTPTATPVYVNAPIVTRPDGHFPTYFLGDWAVLRVATNPPQPEQPVYTWRTMNGQVERDGDLIGHTDAGGVFVNTLPLLDPTVCGMYTQERFAVGDENNPQSPPLSYTIFCPPAASRDDGNYPAYHLGDQAVLLLTTDPPQPNQPVYTWRTKDGQIERVGEFLGYTGSDGAFSNTLTLSDPALCAVYTNEQFAIGATSHPRSASLSYTVYCP